MADVNSYLGSAALGLGSTPAIPAENANLNAINETGRNIQLLDHENNLNIFHQKIKDRDALYQMLDQDKVAIGKIRDEDRGIVNDAQKDANDAYYEMVKGGGMTNREGMRKYKDTLDNLNNVATQAQARYKFLTEEDQAIASTPLPRYQEERKKNLDDYKKKGFWADWTPYQQTANLDMDAIKKNSVNTPFEYNVDPDGKQSPEGKYKVKGSKFDYNQTYKNLRDKYLPNSEDLYYQQQLLGKIEQLPPNEKARTVIGMNGQIDKYNYENGLVKGMDGYVDPVTVTPNGQIAERPTDFSAKWILANQPAFKTQNSELDKFNAGLEQKKQAEADKLKIEAGKLGLGYAKLKEAKRINNARIASLPKEEQDSEISDMYTRAMQEQKGSFATIRDGKLTSEVPAENSLPYYTIKDGKVADLKPFDSEPVYQNPTGKTLKEKGKVLGYTGGYFKYNYITKDTDKPLKHSEIMKAYTNYLKAVPDASFTDFIKESVKANKIDYSVEGANGSTDRKLFTAAQKKVANASQKKGQEGIFDDTETDTETDTNE